MNLINGRHMKPRDRYHPIVITDNVSLHCATSRQFLHNLGIAGGIVSTPGHSADSVALIRDEDSAFTGDLTHPAQAVPMDVAAASWQRIRAFAVKTIYPGHGPSQKVDQLWPAF